MINTNFSQVWFTIFETGDLHKVLLYVKRLFYSPAIQTVGANFARYRRIAYKETVVDWGSMVRQAHHDIVLKEQIC